MMDKQPLRTKAFSVFICYAERDEDLCQEFKKHLAPLQLSGTIAELCDQSTIQPGQERKGRILAYLENADVIFFLVSSDFVESLFCMDQVKRAMEKHANTSSVIPIRIRQVFWDTLPFASLHHLPADDRAVNNFADRDGVWTDITRHVREVLKNLSSLLPENEQVSLDQHLQRGDEFLTNEQYEDALKIYKQVIDMKPNLAVAHSFQGQALYELGRYEDALHACSQAVQLGSQLEATYDYQGLACYRLGLYHEAINAFDQAIKLAPDRAQTYDHKAHVLCRLRHPQDALAYCELALKHDNKLASAYDNKGWALYQLQQYQKALSACEEALQCDPELVTAYYNKGRVLYMLKRDQEALEAYEQAITLYIRSREKGNGTMHLSRNLASMYRNEGKSYIKLRNYEEALKSFEQAVETYEQALKKYEEPPKSTRHKRTLAFYRQTTRAIQQERAETYAWKGEALLLDNAPKKALRAFGAAIERYRDVIQHDTDVPEREDHKKLLALVYVNSGRAHFKGRNYKDVLKVCDMALQYNEGLRDAYYTKADAFEKLHRYKEADEARRMANNLDD